MTELCAQPRREKKDLDAAADVDIDLTGTTFYEGINASKLEAEEFESFWDALAAKNRRHFAIPCETEVVHDNVQSSLLSVGGFDASSQLPGFGLLSLDVPADQARESLAKLMSGRLNRQEIFRRTLEFCHDRREFSEVERAIEAFPEFPLASQSPYQFIKTLVEAGGLRRISLDTEGREIGLAEVKDLTEDEVDDLVSCFVLETTEAGRAIAEEHAPERRLRNLLEKFPDRGSIYRDLLSQVKARPCNYAEIEKLFAGRDFSGIATIGTEKHVALKPSVFVNNMEKAGGLVWSEGRWNITREGEALLGTLIEKGSLV